MASANHSARPVRRGCWVRRLRDRRWVVLLGVLTILVGSGISFLVVHATGAFAAQVIADPIRAPGGNLGVPRVLRDQSKVIAPPNAGRMVPGRAVGLYGGTLDNSRCDSQMMVAFLRLNPDKAAAWASVEGITLTDIPAYVADLTPVILRADTAVTTYGFSNGRATGVHAVLHPGTAVLVDRFGVPRTLCFCGNPVTPDAVVRKFVEDCKDGMVNWRRGQVRYPVDLSLDMDQSAAYVVDVDINDTPLPVEKIFIMPGTDPQSAPIEVQCALSARLIPVGKSLEVDKPGWSKREFTPTGLVDWSWSVTAHAAHDQQLQLELQPALTAQDEEILFEGGDSSKTRTYITSVHVRTTKTQLVYQWWNDSGKIIVAIIGSVAAALIAIIKWGGDLFRAIRNASAELRGKQKQDE
jgi:uncharacterized protein DUF6777